MQNKISNKQLKENYFFILNCGNSNFYYFADQLKKLGCNCGVYGWNYEAYELTSQIVLVDSYRGAPEQGFNKQQKAAARKLVDEYNAKIRDVERWDSTGKATRKRLLNNLIKKMNLLIQG